MRRAGRSAVMHRQNAFAGAATLAAAFFCSQRSGPAGFTGIFSAAQARGKNSMAELDPEQIAAQIAENATGPKRMKSGDVEVEQHSLRDQVAAAQYADQKAAAKKPAAGIRPFRVVGPPN